MHCSSTSRVLPMMSGCAAVVAVADDDHELADMVESAAAKPASCCGGGGLPATAASSVLWSRVHLWFLCVLFIAVSLGLLGVSRPLSATADHGASAVDVDLLDVERFF